MELHHKNCFVGREGLEPSKMSSNQLSYLPILNNRRYMDFDMYPMRHTSIFVCIL